MKTDLSTGSETSRSLFSGISRLPDDDIDQYKCLIYYKYIDIFKYALIYSIIYWLMFILSYIYFSDYMDNVSLGVIIASLNAILLLLEVRGAQVDWKEWRGSMWNWIDAAVLSYCGVTIIVFLSSTEDYDSIGVTWVRLTVVLLLGIRSITWLRIFKPTRYLITMVLAVFVDIIPFIIVLTCGIFIFAFVWRLSPTLGYIDDDTVGDLQLSFYQSLYDSTNIIFGNSPQEDPSGDRFTVIRFILIILGNVSLALVMLNFLIAIISGTYERINDEKDLHDVKALLSIVTEFDVVMARKDRENRRKHLLTIRKLDGSDQQTVKLASIEKTMEEMKNGLDEKFEVVGSRVGGIDKKFEEMDKKVGKAIEGIKSDMEDRLESMETKIEAVMKSLEKISSIVEKQAGLNLRID